MRKLFAQTANTEAFYRSMPVIRGSTRQKAEMGLVVGDYGTGKTETAQHYAAEDENREFVAYVRANDHMTKRELLAAIGAEFGVKVGWSGATAFGQVCDALLEPDRMVIVDEVDYLVASGLVECLRDLYDHTGTPILMVGMEPGVGGTLKRKWPWLFDRMGCVVRYNAFSARELGGLAEQLCEVQLDASALNLIRARYEGRLRPSLRAMAKAEDLARTSGIEVVTADHLQPVLPSADDASKGKVGRR